jgi:hypothetical protein
MGEFLLGALNWAVGIITEEAFTAVLAGTVVHLWHRWRSRRKVTPVEIHVRKVGPSLAAEMQPRVLIATFSGYQRKPAGLSSEEFAQALAAGDLDRLPLSVDTPSIGHTVRLLETYPSLEKVFLIATRSQRGASSLDSVPLLRAFAGRAGMGCSIDPRAVDLDEDNQVTDDTFRLTKRIFESLGKLYKPSGGRVLVDVTGGVRGLQVGALLACLRPDQDAHLIGGRYRADGTLEEGSGFPMVIQFRPGSD